MNDTRRTRAVLAVLLLVSLALITLDFRGGAASPLRGLREMGAAVFGPVERGTANVVHPVASALGTITGGWGATRRARELERENQQLREQLRAGQLDRSRSDQLDRLLRTAGLGGYRVRAAEVISAGHGFEETVTLDVGSQHGIRRDMTVITGDGLVGRVIRVGHATSVVLLITDASSSTGGRMESSKEIGIVQGSGRRGLGADGNTPLRFHLLDPGASLVPGQRVVSFGSQGGQPYVAGVPIGTVTSVQQTPGTLTRTAVLRPFVRFTALDVVGVVVASPKQDPRDAVLPPRPAPPTPSPTGTPSPGRRGEESGRRGSDDPSATPTTTPTTRDRNR